MRSLQGKCPQLWEVSVSVDPEAKIWLKLPEFVAIRVVPVPVVTGIHFCLDVNNTATFLPLSLRDSIWGWFLCARLLSITWSPLSLSQCDVKLYFDQCSERKCLGLQDPDPDPSINSKKLNTLISTVLWFLNDFLSLKTDGVPTDSYEPKIIFLLFWKPPKKRTGSGSVSKCHGSVTLISILRQIGALGLCSIVIKNSGIGISYSALYCFNFF